MSIDFYLNCDQNRGLFNIARKNRTENLDIDPAVISALDQFNIENGKESRVVIILRPNEDLNASLTCGVKVNQWIEMARRGCRVFIETIKHKSQIAEILYEVSQIQPPKTVLFSTHASARHIVAGSDSFYSVDDMEKSHFESVDPECVFIIDACYAGNEFALKLAEITRKTVIASMTTISSLSRVYFCSAHDRHEMVFSDPQSYRVFSPSGAVEFPCASYQEELPSLLAGMTQPRAPRNGKTAFGLGHLYEEASNFKSAYIWYCKAALQNDSWGQHAVGRFLEFGFVDGDKKLSEAYKWYALSAEQANPCAWNELGRFFESGLGGCEVNLEEAYGWYLRAAEQGSPYAQCALGRFFEKGLGGCEQNLEIAIYWYSIAADQGESFAQEAVLRLKK